jgi:hypothetical protein
MSTTEALEEKKARPKLELSIAYNGINQQFEYVTNETVGALRKRALNEYGVHGPERDENFLFGPDNQTELPDDRHLGELVEPGSQLFLRRRAAGGGES